MKRIFSQDQMRALQADMAELLEKHGLTAAYMVSEIREGDKETADLAIVSVSAVRPSQPTAFIQAMAKQTYGIVKTVSRMEGPIINDN